MHAGELPGHPQNENPPSDLAGFYQWSPNLVDWYAGEVLGSLFLRAGVVLS
jgi:hypothetical protein